MMSLMELEIEWEICFDTRIGMLCGTAEPTEKQKQIAAIEADSWFEKLKQQGE